MTGEYVRSIVGISVYAGLVTIAITEVACGLCAVALFGEEMISWCTNGIE
ncbi:MAG: hypothetical protein HXS51_12565 [Theionarchaea archaeon]|nr:hypothetical protein [Theionarchaea archaeon]